MKTATAEKGLPRYGAVFRSLEDPVNFAEALVRMDGGRLVLDRWQADYLRDSAKFINILKSRRVGGSWAMALKMFARSQIFPAYSGTFVSMNLEEAKGKIEYADRMHESLPRRFRRKMVSRSRTELVFEDSRGRRSVLRSLASKAPRGKGGDVGISELPHCLNSRAIYEGALHVTSRSPRHMLTIESTPFGKKGVFHEICEGKFPDFALYRVPWWHCGALCTDLERAREEAPALSTRERVESFGTPSMRAIHASMSEDAFRQESELAFVEAEESAFPLEMLQGCATPSFGAAHEAELPFLSLARPPAPEEWHWLSRHLKGKGVAGYDVGRKRDESVLFVFDDTGGRLEARLMARLERADFGTQEDVLCRAMGAGVTRLAIDSTGIGLPLAELMGRRFGGSVLPVSFTAGVKERLVSVTRMFLMDRGLVLPLERELFSQMRSIERSVSDSGNVVYSVTSSPGHHADIAWALMLAAHAAERTGARVVHYEPLATRRTSWEW